MKKHLARLSVILLLPVVAVALSGCATIKPPKNSVKTQTTLQTTGYCKCKKCCGWQRNWYFKPVIASGPSKGARKKVGVTASGTKAEPGTIAADTSLYPFGTVMYIPGYGYGKVEDRGGAIKGNHIDLYFKTHKQALKWGRQNKAVTVWIPQGARSAQR
ncbi:MAG: 3D domain-containing protein [Candidatus Hydrogenedentes bacterium]|nr:3D domain-containing protein [Candidatus Hydrogenedentota bacterium]